jgi:hypothetical protein
MICKQPFFQTFIDGISDDDRHNRLDTKANHIAWLAGSLVQQRFEIAQAFGSDLAARLNELFKAKKAFRLV